MAGGTPQFNQLYHEWGLPVALLAVAVPLISCLVWLVRKKDYIVETASGEIKQAVTTMFMQTVIDEASRLLKLLDEHLPIALSQETIDQPQRSRFDRFCSSLREINPDELSEMRGRYSNIIRDAFSGVIVDTIKRLMDAAASSSRTVAGDLLNPTALRFEMEGSLYLKFAFVSDRGAKAIARQRRYYNFHKIAVGAILTYSVCSFLLWVPLFIDSKLAWNVCVATLLATAVAAPVGLIAIAISHFSQGWLQEKARTYREESGLVNEFSAWTKDHTR